LENKFFSESGNSQGYNTRYFESYEQGNHAYLSLIADTYCEFVWFLWMVANAQCFNKFLSSLMISHLLWKLHQALWMTLLCYVVLCFHLRMRMQLAAALAKAATTCFMQNYADDGFHCKSGSGLP
jgi:hypothetical protein